jgi:SprT protein
MLFPRLTKQLELLFAPPAPIERPGRDARLEAQARQLLREAGAAALAARAQVEWSRRLRSAAGRADSRARRVTLNVLLAEHGAAEIDRTLRHELAHLLAQFRSGRRRIAPHGAEWKRACADLGIAGEARCHTLPFPIRQPRRGYVYQCPRCHERIARVRVLRRSSACLSCCRAFNRGKYDKRFLLRLVDPSKQP